jgi:hypothetical protein
MKPAKSRDAPPPQEYEEEPNPAVSPSRGDDESAATWESGSQMSGSMISGSSVWSEGTGGDRSSRRALILQMAKARMKSNKESPEKQPRPAGSTANSAPIIDEEDEVEEADTYLTEGATDIDFSADDLD